MEPYMRVQTDSHRSKSANQCAPYWPPRTSKLACLSRASPSCVQAGNVTNGQRHRTSTKQGNGVQRPPRTQKQKAEEVLGTSGRRGVLVLLCKMRAHAALFNLPSPCPPRARSPRAAQKQKRRNQKSHGSQGYYKKDGKFAAGTRKAPCIAIPHRLSSASAFSLIPSPFSSVKGASGAQERVKREDDDGAGSLVCYFDLLIHSLLPLLSLLFRRAILPSWLFLTFTILFFVFVPLILSLSVHMHTLTRLRKCGLARFPPLIHP